MDPSESPVIISYPQENFPSKAILWYRFVRNYVNTFITFLHSTLCHQTLSKASAKCLVRHMIYLTHKHYVKSVHIHCFSCPYFPAFALNTEQKNSKHGNFSCSGKNHQTMHFFWLMDQLPYLILTYFEDIKLFPVKKCFIIQ